MRASRPSLEALIYRFVNSEILGVVFACLVSGKSMHMVYGTGWMEVKGPLARLAT